MIIPPPKERSIMSIRDLPVNVLARVVLWNGLQRLYRNCIIIKTPEKVYEVGEGKDNSWDTQTINKIGDGCMVERLEPKDVFKV